MLDFLSQPWPWYVAGPLIGLIVPALMLFGSKTFGVSSNLRHMCAAVLPTKLKYFNYDWKGRGLWNLVFIGGAVIGGFLAVTVFADPSDTIQISAATTADLSALGISNFTGMVPSEFISWDSLFTLPGFVMVVVGGFLVGFGTRYAGGCTSGHAISGLSNLQLPSLVAVIGFFAGGLAATFFILPLLF